MSALGRWIVDTRRGQASFVIVVIVLVSAATWLAISMEVDRQTQPLDVRVGVIERSPCRVNPQGEACQEVIHELLSALPRVQHCVILRRGLKPDAYVRYTRCPSPSPEGGDSQRPNPQNPSGQLVRPGSTGAL